MRTGYNSEPQKTIFSEILVVFADIYRIMHYKSVLCGQTKNKWSMKIVFVWPKTLSVPSAHWKPRSFLTTPTHSSLNVRPTSPRSKIPISPLFGFVILQLHCRFDEVHNTLPIV